MYNIGEPKEHSDDSRTALADLVQLNQNETILYRPAISTTTIFPVTTTASPTADVSINVTWAFTSGTNVSSFIMTVKNLKTSEWAAIGLGQQQLMVNNFYLPCQN
jgi:hypothetical protein